MKLALTLLASLTLFACAHKGKYHHGDKKCYKKMCKELDANGDGDITEAEFTAAHKKKFANMDANSDGKITKEEWENRGKRKKKCGKCK